MYSGLGEKLHALQAPSNCIQWANWDSISHNRLIRCILKVMLTVFQVDMLRSDRSRQVVSIGQFIKGYFSLLNLQLLRNAIWKGTFIKKESRNTKPSTQKHIKICTTRIFPIIAENVECPWHVYIYIEHTVWCPLFAQSAYCLHPGKIQLIINAMKINSSPCSLQSGEKTNLFPKTVLLKLISNLTFPLSLDCLHKLSFPLPSIFIVFVWGKEVTRHQ